MPALETTNHFSYKCSCFRDEDLTWEMAFKIKWVEVTKLADIMNWLTHVKCLKVCGCVPKIIDTDDKDIETTTETPTTPTTTTTTPTTKTTKVPNGKTRTLVTLNVFAEPDTDFFAYNNCYCATKKDMLKSV